MEQKNENAFLMLKNYSNFLVDLGLNISFSQENVLKMKQCKKEKSLKNIRDIDNYVKDWQIKNNLKIISRNNKRSSKILLLLSEDKNITNSDIFEKNQPELLYKMFASIDQNVDDFFLINIDLAKMKEIYLNKIKEILKLYCKILNPKIFIDMYSYDLNNFL